MQNTNNRGGEILRDSKRGGRTLIYLIVLISVLTRLLPHMPNFSPGYASLLFGGVYLRKRDVIWYPVTLLALGDMLLTVVVYKMRVE